MDIKRLEEVYKKWEQRVPANGPSSNGPCPRPRDRFKEDCQPHRRKRRGRTAALPTLDLVPELAHFKMSPPPTVEISKTQRPFMGRCCTKCAQLSSELFFNSEIPRMGLRNVLKVPKPSRPGLMSRYFPHLNYVLYQGMNYAYPAAAEVSERVLENKRVQLAIHKSAMSESEGRQDTEDEYQKASEKHSRRAIHLLKRMAASISNSLIRITGWLLLKLLGLFLMGVQVHEGQVTMVKQASESGIPVVIVPLHRSHLDYILLSYIFHSYEIRVPFVAAGDNLNIPIFGWCLRRLGAFFIKRKLDKELGKKDWVYRATLHTYMEEILRTNQNMEFFIEGGRSRSGKALAPKGGLLSCVVDAYRDDVITDAYIVPASISYEKILDGSFSNEQMGLPKKPETFARAVQGIWRVLTSGFGNVRVDFGQPFSLKEYLTSPPLPTALNSDLSAVSPKRPKLQKAVSDHSLYGTDVVIEDQRQLIRGLGEHILYDAVKINTIMSTNIVAFLFLTKFRQGVEMAQLVAAVDNLRRDVMIRGRDVGFTGKTEDVVKHTFSLLGPDLVARHKTKSHPDIVPSTENGKEVTVVKEMVVPNMGLPYVFDLSYYGNSLVSVFLMESVVATSLVALCNQELLVLDNARQKKIPLSRDKLIRKAEELCDMLQFEFTFIPPCGNISVAISEAIEQLVVSEVIIPQYAPDTSKWAKHTGISTSWDSDESDGDGYPTVPDQKIEVNTNQESLCRLYFLQSILAPLIEGYWLSACNLVRLLDRDVPEAHFSQVVNAYSKDRVAKGLAIYAESCAMDTLRNSWRLFSYWKVLDMYLDTGMVKMVHLREPYRSEEKLSLFIDRIEAFRS